MSPLSIARKKDQRGFFMEKRLSSHYTIGMKIIKV
jgi:hypothetical protein